jgi:hypothetical protein
MKTENAQTPPEKTPAIEPESSQKSKRKNKLVWALIMIAIYSLGFLSFGTMFSPKEGQTTQQLFVTALGESAKNIVNPSGRVVTFKNSWQIPTVRVVLISDYSYGKTEGRCVSYHYPFVSAQHKECFPLIPRDKISESYEEVRD